MNPPDYTSLPERFWSKVDEPDENGCWLWNAAIKPNGYGWYGGADGTFYPHRLSAADAKGDIPEGLLVLHHCDVRNCVNPEHLYFGTYQDNANDKYRRGRGNIGEINGNNKLSKEDVIEARAMHATGEHSYTQLAARYGVEISGIRLAIIGKNWAWLKDGL